MRFGMQLPVQSQSSYYAEGWESTAGSVALAHIATACDRAGFDYIGVCDHVAIPAEKAQAMGTVWYDTVATLGWLAGITEQIKLLSHVYVPAYRHPLMTAKAFATIDDLSDGRVILGVGAGHVEAEFDVLGVAFGDRGQLTDAAIDDIRTAWSSEFGAGDFGLKPMPTQPGGPPIWVGGSSPAAIRRAAQRGDGWLPQGTTKAEMPAAIAKVHALRAEAGRDNQPFTVGAILRPLFLGDPGPDWDLGKATLAKDTERIIAEVQAYQAIGCDQVQIRFRSRSAAEYCEQIEAFADEVMTEFPQSKEHN